VKPSSTGMVVAVVVVLVGVFSVAGFLLAKPERRAQLVGVCINRREPQFRYQKMGDVEASGGQELKNLFDDDEEDEDDDDDEIIALS
jgi:hypothetical protein